MPAARSRTRFLPLAWLLPVLLGLGSLAWMVALLAPPVPPPPVRVVIGPWIGYEPFVLARENDWLDPRLRLVETPSSTETVQALRDGTADVAGLTLDETIRLRSEGVPVRIIAVLSDSRGADAVVGRPGITDLAQLRGQRVLVEDTAVGYHMLNSALATVGMTRDDVRQVQAQSALIPSRWREGNALAAVVHEPTLSQLLDDGATVLFSTADHPGLVLDVLVAREAVIEKRPGDLALLLDAWDRAYPFFASPDRLPLAVLTADGRIGPQEYRSALAGVEFFDGLASQQMMAGQPSELSGHVDRLLQSLQQGQSGLRLRSDEPLVAPEVGRMRKPGRAPVPGTSP